MGDPGWERPPKILKAPPFAGIRLLSGVGAICPREDAPPRPPLAETDISGHSFAGNTEG